MESKPMTTRTAVTVAALLLAALLVATCGGDQEAKSYTPEVRTTGVVAVDEGPATPADNDPLQEENR